MNMENISGSHNFQDGSIYVGQWNSSGKPHGKGSIIFPDGIEYHGSFSEGQFSGMGALFFPDGAKYEGEFLNGWFHGLGTFWRADNMKHEGEYRGGQICGSGVTTFNDGCNGFPKYEGYFNECKFLKKYKCPETIQCARRFSFISSKKAKEIKQY